MSTLTAPINPAETETEGVSEDFFEVMRSKFRSYREYRETAITLVSAEQAFAELAATWKAETRFTSSIDDIVLHPAHLAILGLGKQAIPWILRELKREPGHWFFALNILTGENPVPPSLRGDMAGMTRAWINWAATKQF